MKKLTKGQIIGIALLSVVIGSVFGMYGLPLLLNYLSVDNPFDTDTPATTFIFNGYDYVTQEEIDDAAFAVYSCDTTGLDADEIAILAFADYALEGTKVSGQAFTPDADHIYYVEASRAGFVTQWFVPVLGDNDIYLMNQTEDTAIACWSLMGVTCANTDCRDWNIIATTLDAAEGATAKRTVKEGFLPYFDFENDLYNRTVIQVRLNVTATIAYCDLVGYSDAQENEVCSTTYIYYQVDTVLLGTANFQIKFNSALGTTYEVVSIAIGYGSATGFTAWDTQV